MDLDYWLSRAANAIADWQETFGSYDTHPALAVSDEQFGAAFGEFTDRLKDNYPFFTLRTPDRC